MASAAKTICCLRERKDRDRNNLCSAIGGVSAETVLERERRLSRT